MPFRIQLPQAIHEQMVAHALRDRPNECCGLLAGTDGTIVQAFPLVNALASPTAYSAEPRSLLQAVKAARTAGLDVLGFYHSHPTSAPIPSRTDLEQNWWGGDVVFFIISLADPTPAVRAWRLAPADYQEVPWDAVDH